MVATLMTRMYCMDVVDGVDGVDAVAVDSDLESNPLNDGMSDP